MTGHGITDAHAFAIEYNVYSQTITGSGRRDYGNYMHIRSSKGKSFWSEVTDCNLQSADRKLLTLPLTPILTPPLN